MRLRHAPSVGGDVRDRRDALPSVGTVSGEAPMAAAARYLPSAELGRGGMGCIRLVEDVQLHRQLAWKEGDVGVLREAWITAQLEHPGIVPVHDLGVTAEGQSFFAMRVVRGETLDAAFARLGTEAAARRERVRLLLAAVQAVAWAHHRGVVHRDLKPANVLVGPFGEVQVIDWGLAWVLDEAAVPLDAAVRAAVCGLALDSHAVGTAGYMAPEQAAGAPPARTVDVYALGLLLQEAIGSRADAAIRSVVSRCTARDPRHRYPDAQALAGELAAWLDGRPVRAPRYRLAERMERFVGRHKGVLASTTLGALGFAVLLGVAGLRVEREREVAVEARIAAEHALADTLALRAEAAVVDGLWHEAVPLASESLLLAENARARGVLAALAGAPGLRFDPLDPDAELGGCRELDWAGAAGRERVLCSAGDEVTVRARAPGWPVITRLQRRHERAALSPDGEAVWLLSGCEPVTVVPLDPSRPSRRHPAAGGCPHFDTIAVGGRGALLWGPVQVGQLLLGDTEVRLLPTCANPQAATLAAGDQAVVLCEDGGLWVGRLGETPARKATLPLRRHEVEGSALAMNDDVVFVGDTRGHVHRVPLTGAGPTLRARVTEGLVRTLEVSPDGRHLAVAGDVGGIFLLDAMTLGRTGSLPAGLGHRARFLAEGALVPWGPGARGSASVIVSLDGGQPVAFEAFDGVTSLAVSPSSLLVGHMTHATWLDRAGRVGPQRASGRGETVKAVALGPEEQALFATAANYVARWAHPRAGPEALPAASGPRRLVLAGDWLVAVPPRGPPRAALLSHAARPEAWQVVPATDAPGSWWLDLAPVPDRPVAFALSTRLLHRFDLSQGNPRSTVVFEAPDASSVAAFPGGDRVALAIGDRVVLRDLGGAGSAVELLTAGGARSEPEAPDLRTVAVDRTGRWVAAGARDGRVYLWDVAAPEPRAILDAHRERVAALVFGDDLLWSGGWDGVVRRFALDVLRAERTELGGGAGRGWTAPSPAGLLR